MKLSRSPVEPTQEHLLQLFDTPESLANVVSTFLHEGWEHGDNLLVAAKPAHWRVTSRRLERRGCPVFDAIEGGRLTVLDAADTLKAITREGSPDAARFHAEIGALVERLAAASPTGLRIYGELVEVLAEEGDFDGARQLENLWNGLRQRVPFTLLCGYSAAHFADSRHAAALRAICATHTCVRRNASDLLGSWLLADGREATAG